MVLQAVENINKANAEKFGKTEFDVGDALDVYVKIHEGEKERVQVFKGTVIAMDGSGATGTFTVRRISHGVGIERVFPLCSPYLDKVEVTRSAQVRRAKLYYLRKLRGKKARLKERIRKS